MRSSQWFILGLFFILMSFWFIKIDMGWNLSCINSYDQELIKSIDVQACIKSEVYAPFIWLLFPLGIIFAVFGWIEYFNEKKKGKWK